MASASTIAASNSGSKERDFTDVESDEEENEEDVEWVDAPFFPMEHVLDKYKYQARKAMKKPMLDDHVHKKLS